MIATRLKHAARFVAIVWSLAASFLLVHLFALGLTDYIPVGAALSAATLKSRACHLDRSEESQRRTDIPTPLALTAAWRLGYRVGVDAQLHQQKSELARNPEVGQFTALLAVPDPSRFEPQHALSAYAEFIEFVEEDAQRTAHGLAVAYSREACVIYKLGAFWGYTFVTRLQFPDQPTLLQGEIDHYARQLGLPEPLWAPMLTLPQGADDAARQAEAFAITERVSAHLQQPR